MNQSKSLVIFVEDIKIIKNLIKKRLNRNVHQFFASNIRTVEIIIK